MKTPSPTEIAVQLAKDMTLRDVYIKALAAERNQQTLADFIKTLETLMNKA